MSSVFISGSIAVKKIPNEVEISISRIIEENMSILVGDADGMDAMVQDYCKRKNYKNVTVYSIYSSPRYKIPEFNKKHIDADTESKKERERQKAKDTAMTEDSDYSLVVWDGKSKGSYQNILRAIKNEKKVKVYLQPESRYLESSKITNNEIDFIYRENNGYTAKEVVEYLKSEGKDYFSDTRTFNKCMLEHEVIKKEDKIYLPMPEHEDMFIINKYRGKVTGIKFNNRFIGWLENWIKNNKPQEELDI